MSRHISSVLLFLFFNISEKSEQIQAFNDSVRFLRCHQINRKCFESVEWLSIYWISFREFHIKLAMCVSAMHSMALVSVASVASSDIFETRQFHASDFHALSTSVF